jgi:hypothetical protein
MDENVNQDEDDDEKEVAHHLERYGLRPTGTDLDEIRERLDTLTATSRDGMDTLIMRLMCVQLFNAGQLQDVLRIWAAKESSWDAHISIDVVLLCGPGHRETKEYLGTEGSTEAAKALDYILECDSDFVDFSPSKVTASNDSLYS